MERSVAVTSQSSRDEVAGISVILGENACYAVWHQDL